eukprot:364511-Chlamydomonas_euryale.AAC.2
MTRPTRSRCGNVGHGSEHGKSACTASRTTSAVRPARSSGSVGCGSECGKNALRPSFLFPLFQTLWAAVPHQLMSFVWATADPGACVGNNACSPFSPHTHWPLIPYQATFCVCAAAGLADACVGNSACNPFPPHTHWPLIPYQAMFCVCAAAGLADARMGKVHSPAGHRAVWRCVSGAAVVAGEEGCRRHPYPHTLFLLLLLFRWLLKMPSNVLLDAIQSSSSIQRKSQSSVDASQSPQTDHKPGMYACRPAPGPERVHNIRRSCNDKCNKRLQAQACAETSPRTENEHLYGGSILVPDQAVRHTFGCSNYDGDDDNNDKNKSKNKYPPNPAPPPLLPPTTWEAYTAAAAAATLHRRRCYRPPPGRPTLLTLLPPTTWEPYTTAAAAATLHRCRCYRPPPGRPTLLPPPLLPYTAAAATTHHLGGLHCCRCYRPPPGSPTLLPPLLLPYTAAT